MTKTIFLACCAALPLLLAAQQNQPAGPVQERLKMHTLSFVENKGQFADEKGNVREDLYYLASGKGFSAAIRPHGITYLFTREIPGEERIAQPDRAPKRIETARIEVELAGATIAQSNISASEETDEYFNYYYTHCPEGITYVRSYKEITVREVYPGIDWKIYTVGEQGMKYDFIVHPGADPNRIRLIYHGAESLVKNSQEDRLSIRTKLGEVEEGALLCYEEGSGKKIASAYALEGNQVRISLGEFDRSETLVIDPALFWGTFFGGTSLDGPVDVAEGNGSWFMTGYTTSTTGNLFPIQSIGGGYNDNTIAGTDCFIARFNNWGGKNWTTYYGGTSTMPSYTERGMSIAANGSFVVVTGETSTQGTDFPTSTGCYQNTAGGGAGTFDAFYLKFNLNGVRQYATLLGGASSESGAGICMDNSNNVYITGRTGGSFPTTVGAFQTTYGGAPGALDGFITRFGSGNTFDWSTYYGGNGTDQANAIEFDGSSNLYIVGSTTGGLSLAAGAYQGTYQGGTSDAFILKFTTGGARSWDTYFGGSGSDQGYGVETDAAFGYFFIAGFTSSSAATFPLANAQQGANGGNADLFISKLTVGGGAGMVNWSTFYGGAGNEGIGAMDCSNMLSLSGDYLYLASSSSGSFPTITLGPACAYNQTVFDGMRDGVILRIDKKAPTGYIDWATYYGGSSSDWLNGLATYDKDLVVCGEFGGGSYLNSSPARQRNPGLSAYSQVYRGSDEGVIAKFNWCAVPYAGPDQNACCAPATFTFGPTANACQTYSWVDNLGNTYSGTPVVVTISAQRTFTLTVTNSECGGGTATDVIVMGFGGSGCCPRLAAPAEGPAATFFLSPNPGPGVFNISYDGEIGETPAITVYDATGRVVLQQARGSDLLSPLDISGHAPGMYYVEMNLNGKAIVRKVIIQ